MTVNKNVNDHVCDIAPAECNQELFEALTVLADIARGRTTCGRAHGGEVSRDKARRFMVAHNVTW